MKLWSNYSKEMKIASRGFYFYMEIVMAAILLVVILLLVPVDATTVSRRCCMPMCPPKPFAPYWSKASAMRRDGWNARRIPAYG